jgi:hypothetical protein
MANQERYTVYDLETICNLFTGCFQDFESKQKKQFIIHKSQNDFEQLYEFLFALRKYEYYLVGFNNVEFDGQIIHFIMCNYQQLRLLPGDRVARVLYAEAQRVLTAPEKERYLHNVSEKNLSHKQIDLYKQKHYDGKAKRTSLKWLEFTMRMPNIEEMPIPHDVEVEESQIKDILSYNWNDVEATYEFFKRNKFETELRQKLSDKFGINLLNASEPRMAREILAKLLAEDSGIKVSELKEKRTFRKEIHLGKCIIPRVKFSGSDFNGLVAEMKKTTINANNTKECFKYSMNYKGINIEYGVGGVHGTSGSGIYTSDEDYIIKTVDVKSFYPNMIINYGFTPAHLGQTFSNRYKWFYDERIKLPKKDPTNYVYKIILNSTYGLSNDMNSFLYDTLVTMKTTINGQLLLSMLAESLSGIPDSKLIMMNTDGLEIRIPRRSEEDFTKRCRVWEESTGLELEFDEYDKIILSDVNNYIGIFAKRKAKTEEEWNNLKASEPYYVYEREGDNFYYSPSKLKGRFELKLDWHKNPSGIIITQAVFNHLVKGVPVRETIEAGDNLFDFCFGVKKKYDFELVLHKVVNREHIKEKQQKVARFYMSSDGGKLVKEFRDGRIVSVSASTPVTPANRICDISVPNNLDRQFYITEALKEVHNVTAKQNNQLSMF